MESNPSTIFKNICDVDAKAPEILKQLSSLNNLLVKEQLTASSIDEYLLNAFNTSNGLITFMTNIVNNKEYSKCMEKSLEIIYVLINNFPKKIHRNLPAIFDICILIIKSRKTSSYEKRKAYEILIISFAKIDSIVEFMSNLNTLYEWLTRCLDVEKTDTVLEKLLIALGTFARNFPSSVNEPLKIRKIMVNFTRPINNPAVIAGAFRGLCEFCYNFPFDKQEETDSFVIQNIYKTIKNLTTPSSNTHSKVSNRAALTFLLTFNTLFEEFIIKEIEFWRKVIDTWIEFNSEDRKVGIALANSVYQTVSNFVVKNNDPNHVNMLRDFNTYFLLVINKNYCPAYKRALALEGFSLFATAFQLYLSESEYNKITLVILKLFEKTSGTIDDELEFLPYYIKVCTNYLQLQAVDKEQIARLQKGVVNMIKQFPRFHETNHRDVVDAIISCFYYLKSNKDDIYDDFVKTVVYQSVVWTCSHQHICDADFSEDNSENIITIKNYLKLWKGLLSNGSLYSRNIEYEDRIEISTKIVEKLVKTLLVLTNKLNVQFIPTNATRLTDLKSAYRVAEENDFAIFLNLADFYQEVFKVININIISKCIDKLIQHFIGKCMKYPYISGFYKLLAIFLEISSQMNYFKDSDSFDSKMCFNSLKKFINVLLVKFEQFTDELLISALQVLLECPPLLIQDMLPLCIPAFITIITTGKSYIKLVNLTISKLEFWQNEIPYELFKPFLQEILPHLDFFLRSNSLDIISCTNLETVRKTDQVLIKRRVNVEIESELHKLQKNILNFIGTQNCELYESFVFSDNSIDLAVWGNNQHLKVFFPYEDARVEFYVDKLLPKVIDLAVNSTDNKTKIAACEVLHSIVVVFLGTTKQMSQSGIEDLSKLFKHLIYPLLKLGCDLNQCVRNLFEPLVLQLIHWYTHRSQAQTNEHSVILIDAIMDGITNPSDSILRDFSGKCTNEYIKWTIKQSSQKSLLDNPKQIKHLINQIRFFSLHPDLFKKQGAALIFNNIYCELREELALLNMFWIELLHIFIKSLTGIDAQSDNSNAIAQINNALEHLQRVFVEKNNLFNDPNSNRRVPSGIKSELLKDVAAWILIQTGSNHPACRKSCMDLFIKIAPLSKGFVNFEDFVKNNVSTDLQSVYMSFIIEHPTLESFQNTGLVDYTLVLKWHQSLLRALDGLDFIIKHGAISSKTLLKENVLNTSVHYFLKELVTKQFSETLTLLRPGEWSYSIFEEKEFNNLKSQIVLKLFQFLNTLLTHNRHEDVLEVCYSTNLWNLVVYLIFSKDILGFDTFVNSESTNTTHFELLNIFFKRISKPQLDALVLVVQKYISENFEIDFKLKTYYSPKERNVVKGLLMLQLCNVAEFKLEDIANGMLRGVLENLENQPVFEEFSDLTANYISDVFEFCLHYESGLNDFLSYPTIAKSIWIEEGKETLFGLYIIENFEVFAEVILKKFDYFLDNLLGCNNEENLKLVYYMLTYVENNKQRKIIKDTIIKCLLRFWDKLQNYFEVSFTNMLLGVSFVKSIFSIGSVKVSNYDYSNVKKWLIKLINDSIPQVNYQKVFEFKIDVFSLLTYSSKKEDDLGLCTSTVSKALFPNDFNTNLKIIGLNRLLTIIPNINNSNLLMFILFNYAILSKEENVIEFADMLKIFVTRAEQDLQTECLISIYEMCLTNELDITQKYNLILAALPAFQHCLEDALEKFFTEKISAILNTLQQPTDQHNVTIKTINFMLIELMFLRCPFKEVSPITQSALSGNSKNKDLFKKFLTLSFESSTTSENYDEEYYERIRVLKCHSYNCSVSIICNCIKDIRFYNKLFARKDCALWRELVDINKNYTFEFDFDVLPKNKKILVNIRDELRASRIGEESNREMKYLESRRVYNSSLSSDFSKFDFTESIIRTQQDNNGEINLQKDKVVHTEIVLDGLDVNRHECMATVCGLIEHMFQTGLVQIPEEDSENAIIPEFLEPVRKLLLDKNSHENEKIFWIKVIDNTSHFLQPLAKFLMEPLLQFIVEKCTGDSLNYFTTDIISLLASWSVTTIPATDTERELASKLIRILISDLSTERRDKFKYYLELIKLITESWNTILKVPYDLIQSKMNIKGDSKDSKQSRHVEVGVHLCSIFLANNIAPWEKSYSELNLFRMIIQCSWKSIYRPIAETIALALHYLQNKPDFNKALNSTHKLLKCLTNQEQHANVLDALVLHFPSIANASVVEALIFKIDSVSVDLQLIYLRVILKQVNILNEIREFKLKDWSNYLKSVKVEIQIIMLDVIHSSLLVLQTGNYFEKIIQTVFKFIDNSNVVCRLKLYEIAISLCESVDEELQTKCLDVLIQGFMDKDEALRERVRNFWRESCFIPTSIENRFNYILGHLYRDNAEDDFLGYSCYLLLDILRVSDEYSNNLFEHPLEDCHFENYNLNLNRSFQSQAIVPMFAGTFRSYSEDAPSESVLSSSDFNQLRQTKDFYEFDPTQSIKAVQSQYTMSESSLAVSLESQSPFLNPNTMVIRNDYKKPTKKRFLKDQNEVRKFFAKKEVSKALAKYNKRIDLAKQRDNKITLYRKYRIGDLPDIQISLKAFVEPLQVLTLLDGETAKIIYLAIFNSIVSKLEVIEDFIAKISLNVKNIFSISTQHNINLFRTLFTIVLKHKKSILLEPELITNICQSSGLISIGALLIEEYLLDLDDSEPTTTKRTLCNNTEATYWLKLTELYKSIDEWDVVKAIFLEKLGCKDYAKEALIAESEKDWRRAEELYKILLGTNTEEETKCYYRECHLKSLAHLAKWNDVVDSIREVSKPFFTEKIGDANSKNQVWYQQKLLPWHINAQLKKSLFSGKRNELLTELNDSLLSNNSNSNYLRNRFSEEMAILFVAEDDINEAEQCITTYLNNFLYKWQLLDTSYYNHRYNNLLKLRNIVDINKFINIRSINSEIAIKDFIRYWQRTNDQSPLILATEMRVLYRKQFVEYLEEKLRQYNNEEFTNEFIDELKHFKMSLFANIIDAAISENNFDLTRKYLLLCRDQPLFKFYLAKVGFIKLLWMEEPEQKVKMLVQSSLEMHGSLVGLSDNPEKTLEAHLCLFTHLYQLSQVLNRNQTLFASCKASLAYITKDWHIECSDDIAYFGATNLKTYLQAHQDYSLFRTKSRLLGDSYVKLAYFSNKKEKFCNEFVFCVLRGMKFDSSEAKQLFPCILLHNLSLHVQEMFINEVENIPLWVFLDWIPQILTSIDSENIAAIEPLILKIAKTYPQAVMYSYRLSKENYKFNNERVKEKADILIEKLDKIMCANVQVDQFLKALSYVGVPFAILMYYVRKLMKLLSLNKETEFQSSIDNVIEELFNQLADSRDSTCLQGNLFKQIRNYKKDLLKVKVCGVAQKKETLQTMNAELIKKLQSMFKTKNDLLKNFSPWLASFSTDQTDFELEIPGQYDSKKLPLIQYHIKIAGFCPNVIVVSSLRKPIKLTFLGHDGKEYPYLVKFGEDLRQDQRIQQLFNLMNDIVSNDKANISHDLSIQTYKVVPLTPKLGLIEWIEDTESFHDFISKSSQELKNDHNYELYMKFILGNKKCKNEAESYSNAAINYKSQKVIPFYRSLVNSIPCDVMKTSFWNLSINTEGYCTLRTNFIKNYAVLCASHWLLGIGDRHLQNSLIFLKNGKVLGVDFGHAFGTATQFLPIPELVPFRLTPHIVNLMEPLGERGLFREIMIFFLRLMRTKSNCLLATMDVFIREPSLDWLEHVTRFADNSATLQNQNWYPQLKISQAKQKLLGASSTLIMTDELTMGQQNNPALAKLKEFVKGTPGENVRAEKYDDELSVEDQVDILIDHATDYNLLGRMLAGWQPWV